MMRFRKDEQYQMIAGTIRDELGKYGLHALRADDRAYSDDLWDNVCVYMLGCEYGVAVFEEIDERHFNPNVALELGFMFALGKRCLLLRDGRMRQPMHADIVGKLYKEYDIFKIGQSIPPCLEAWVVRDLGLGS